MNVFAASDLEAADVLALARLDDDGAPPAVIPPARDGQRRHAIRLPAPAGTPPRPYTDPDGSAPRPPSQAAPAAPRGQPGSRPAP
jgi:hypothetical protein